MKSYALLLLLPISHSLLSATASGQTRWYVSPTGSDAGAGTLTDPFATIQFAVSRPATVDGDEVRVLPGVYPQVFDFDGKAITVQGGDANNTILNGDGIGTSIVTFASGEGPDSVLRELTLQNGEGTLDGTVRFGGAVSIVGASPRLVDCNILQGTADAGGAVAVRGGSPRIEGCAFATNEANLGGAVYIEDAAATLEDCNFTTNRVTSNSVFAEGAGLWVGGSSNVRVRDSSFLGNETTNDGEGGGIFVATGAVVRVFDSIFESNEAGDFATDQVGDGGAISADGTLVARGCTFTDNGALLRGGAVFGGIVFNSTFRLNRAEFGGAASGAELEDCLFEDNVALSPTGSTDNGGAVETCTVRSSVLRGNSAFGDGGAAYLSTLEDCLIEDNTSNGAFPLDPRGGGIAFSTAIRCIIRGNSAGPGSLGTGGGAWNSVLERCVLFENSAGIGGGAYSSEFRHCAVVGNTASTVGGGVDDDSQLVNSILWGNMPNQISAGSTATYCDVQGGVAGTGNFDADPLFWNPVSGDLHLMAGSPCIDAGNPMSATDPDGSTADVGAFPFDAAYCGEPGTYCSAKASSQGCLPAIGFLGSPSLSGADDFHVTASDTINQQPGFLLWSLAPDSAPFMGGTLCVALPVVRTPVQFAGGTSLPAIDCTGTYDFFFSQAYATGQGLAAGDRLYAQYWFRDPSQPDGTGIGLTDALEFTLCP